MAQIVRSEPGYKMWERTRHAILERDNYQCTRCGWDGRSRRYPGKPRLLVHHIKDRNKYPKLEFVSTNLRTLCVHCHSVLHEVGYEERKEDILAMLALVRDCEVRVAPFRDCTLKVVPYESPAELNIKKARDMMDCIEAVHPSLFQWYV